MKTFAAVTTILLITLASPEAYPQPGTVCGAWSAVSTPGSGTLSMFSSAAALSTNDVWAVGHFDVPEGYSSLSQTLTAHWNGNTWSVVPSPNAGLSGSVLSGAAGVAANDVWAVGYSSIFGSPSTLTLHWNGTAWATVPSPTVTGGSSFGAACAIAANDVWAVGTRAGSLPGDRATVSTLVSHWNGSNWSVVPSPNVSNRFHDLVAMSAASASDVWAVGTSRNITELFQTLALHWNGSAWSVVPTPNLPGAENELTAVAAIASDDVWAIGSVNDGIAPTSLFMHWNGSSWTIVPAPGGPQACMGCSGGLLAIASNDVWAAGSNLAHWDGTSWSLVPNPTVPDASSLAFNFVVKAGPCEAWAVGHSYLSTGLSTLAAHLTPGGGSLNQPPVAVATGVPTSGPAPLTVSFSSDGSHDPDGSIVSYFWEFGDRATNTSTDPSPSHTYIQTGPLTYHATLTVTDNQGGMATSAVEISVLPSMHAQSQLVDRAISSEKGGWFARDEVLIVDHQDLPLAGAMVTVSYTGPTGGTISGITDGNGRVTLGTLPAQVASSTWCFSLVDVTNNGSVYQPSANVVTSQCEDAVGLDVSQGAGSPGNIALAIWPNPIRESGAIQLNMPGEQPATVRVFDANGRLVREVVKGLAGRGTHTLRWDGRDDSGHPVGSGLYFVTARAGGQIASLRVLMVR